jgi:prolipoprotein diacylglyceryltransferase
MATFFYEFVWNMIVFFILMSIRKKTKRRGDLVCWYTMLYCAGRTVIEGLRDDSLLLNVGGAQVRVSQIISGVACLAVAALFFIRLCQSKKIKPIDIICSMLAALGIACAFIGEFERNAYQMLFIPAQIVLGAILALNAAFVIAYARENRSLGTPGAAALVSCFLCIGTLALGIGRLGENNIAYIALRQSVAMLQIVLAGAWFYLQQGRNRRRNRVTEPAAAQTPLGAEEPAPGPAEG